MKSFDKFLEEMKKIDGNLITEEVINELTDIFNAAVDVRAGELKNELKEEMKKEAEELKEEEENEAKELRDEIITEAEEFKSKLIDTLDTFLEETVNEFHEKYENNIKSDIEFVFYENFYKHVKEGLDRYNLELNESDIDLISSLKNKLEEKDEIINTKIDEIYELKKSVLIEKVTNIFDEKTKDMTVMEKTKLFGLIEEVEFEDEYDAEKKLNLFIDKFNDVEINENENDNEDSIEFSLNEKYEKKKVKNTLNEDGIAQKWARLM